MFFTSDIKEFVQEPSLPERFQCNPLLRKNGRQVRVLLLCVDVSSEALARLAAWGNHVLLASVPPQVQANE
jgi:hypothetical protein